MFKRLIGRFAIRSGKCTESEIEEKAELFAEQLPPDAFAPAQVQNFLQSCRGDPDKVVSEVGDWARRNRHKVASPTNLGEAQQVKAACAKGSNGDTGAGADLVRSNGNGVPVPDHTSDLSLGLDHLAGASADLSDLIGHNLSGATASISALEDDISALEGDNSA